MRPFFEKLRILGWLALVLAVGFLTTGTAGYKVAHEAVQRIFAAASMPAISDLVHAEIQKDLLRSALASSQIAQDAFVRNWLLGGERDPGQISRHLKEADRKYGASGLFLVSERSRRHYQGDGSLAPVRPEDARDAWFFRLREMKAAYEISASADFADSDATAVSIGHRIVDEQGNFIGATGIALPQSAFSRRIENYQSRFGCRIRFADKAGIVILGSDAMQHLRDLPGLRQVAADIQQISATPVQTSYRQGEATVLVNTRFMPELGWFLVVEQSDREASQPVLGAFLLNLAVGTLVTAIVLVSVLCTIKRYRQRLANAAGIDPVTGLMNRQAYEFVFQQTLLETGRTHEPLSLILFEIDLSKRVANTLGQKARDQVLQNLTTLARKSVRGSDPVARWSDGQFIIQLRDCPLDKAATAAERLRMSVAAHDFGLDDRHIVVTVSLGVAKHEPQEAGSDFLERASQALGEARARGGNRVEPEVPGVDYDL